MNLLLDSHTFALVRLGRPAKLSSTAKALIQDPANQKFAERSDLLGNRYQGRAEEARPRRTGHNLPASGTGDERVRSAGDRVGPCDVRARRLPPHHKDPFDRLLVAQAMIEKLPLVSADAILDPYGIHRIW